VILSRRVVYALVTLLLLLYSFNSLNTVSELKKLLNGQYLSYKQFLVELSGARERPRLDEGFIRELSARLGLSFDELSFKDGVYALKAREVPGVLLVELLYELERAGKVEELEAVDNTGKGVFTVEIRVRPF